MTDNQLTPLTGYVLSGAELEKAISDVLSLVSMTGPGLDALHDIIPHLPENRLLWLYGEMRGIMGKAWYIRAHIIAEAIDRHADLHIEKSEVMESVQAMYRLGVRTVRTDARIWREILYHAIKGSALPFYEKLKARKWYEYASQSRGTTRTPLEWTEYAYSQVLDKQGDYLPADLKAEMDHEKGAGVKMIPVLDFTGTYADFLDEMKGVELENDSVVKASIKRRPLDGEEITQ